MVCSVFSSKYFNILSWYFFVLLHISLTISFVYYFRTSSTFFCSKRFLEEFWTAGADNKRQFFKETRPCWYMINKQSAELPQETAESKHHTFNAPSLYYYPPAALLTADHNILKPWIVSGAPTCKFICTIHHGC